MYLAALPDDVKQIITDALTLMAARTCFKAKENMSCVVNTVICMWTSFPVKLSEIRR